MISYIRTTWTTWTTYREKEYVQAKMAYRIRRGFLENDVQVGQVVQDQKKWRKTAIILVDNLY